MIDEGLLTIAELSELLSIANTIHFQHPIYMAMTMRWDVRPDFGALMLTVAAKVPDRNSRRSPAGFHGFPAHWSDQLARESHDPRRYESANPEIIRVQTGKALVVQRSELQGPREALIARLVSDVRSLIIEFMTHELDEMLLVNDARYKEPHADDPFHFTFGAKR